MSVIPAIIRNKLRRTARMLIIIRTATRHTLLTNAFFPIFCLLQLKKIYYANHWTLLRYYGDVSKKITNWNNFKKIILFTKAIKMLNKMINL